MSTKKTLHKADGSMLGFLFQIERVLYWLSTTDSDGVVGVEVDDDIVVELQKGQDIEKVYEQAKNTQLKSKTPFSDNSEDLWKTLSIWVELVSQRNVNPDLSIFSAISNKKTKSNQLLKRLNDASSDNLEELEILYNDIKERAQNLRSGLKKYGDIVIGCDKDVFQKLMNNIRILDIDYSHDQHFKKKLRNALKISDDLPFDHIYNGLLGHVTNVLIDCWKQKKEAWISVRSFLNLYTTLIVEFKNKKFIEKATEFLPVSKEEIKRNKGKTYVEQLKLIGCEEDEILESIEHYLRAASEKSRFAKEGDVTEAMYSKYYEDLIENWKSISRPRFRACKDDKEKFELVGYEVFYETLRYKGKLNNQEPEQSYTHKGAYHYLSNDVQLGWHPEWETKFRKNRQ